MLRRWIFGLALLLAATSMIGCQSIGRPYNADMSPPGSGST